MKALLLDHGLRIGSYGLLRAAGFRWELRRFGDTRLGLWRKKTTKEKKAAPRRFVLIPGFGDSPISWLGLITALQPLLRGKYDEIVMFEFPGFNGYLADQKAFQSMDHLIRAVSDAMDSLRPHTILGHSLGAWLATLYAAAYGSGDGRRAARYTGPELLLLGSPSGAYESEEGRQEWENLFKRMMGEEGFNALRPHMFVKEPSWFSAIAPRFERFAKQGEIIQFMSTVTEKYRLEKLLPMVRSKVWIFWGARDTLIPPTHLKTWLGGLQASQGQARALVFKGVGHSPHIERPLVTLAALARIIRDQVKGDATWSDSRWWEFHSAPILIK